MKILSYLLLLGLSFMVACANPPVPDTTLPTVVLSINPVAPVAGGSIILKAVALDNVGVVQVKFFLGSTSLGVDFSSPYELIVPANLVSSGDQEFKAVAADAAGNVQETKLVVAVAVADATPPTLTLGIDKPILFVGNTALLTADATDNVGVKQVQFFINETSLGIDTSAPFEQTVAATNIVEGFATFKAIATDAIGLSSETRLGVVVNLVDTTPPIVGLRTSSTAPLVGQAFKLLADAEDDVAMRQVEFLNGDTSLGVDTTAPFEQEITAVQATVGVKAFKAVATDANGNTDVSALNVEVVVPNISFTVKLKQITIANRSPDEFDQTLQIVGSFKAQLQLTTGGVQDEKVTLSIPSVLQPIILRAGLNTFDNPQVLQGTNLPNSKIVMLGEVFEKDSNTLLHKFSQVIGSPAIPLSAVVNATAQNPAVLQFQLNTQVGTSQAENDSILVFFEIFRNP